MVVVLINIGIISVSGFGYYNDHK